MEENKFELKSDVDGKFLMYKGLPLVREDNVICYGSMDNECILRMTIMTTKTEKGAEVPDRILVQIVKTDKSLSEQDKIVKQVVKSGFYDAFEIGTIWLERYTSQK